MRNILRYSLVFALVLCCVSMLFACNNPDNPDDEIKVFTPYAGMDEVVYSHTRLANADFSFNFKMNDGEVTAAPTAMAGNPVDNINPNDYFGRKYEFDTKYLEEVAIHNYFEAVKPQLERFRKTAREIVDFCIDNITVMNKRVEVYSREYVLSYDSTKDIIYVLADKNESKYEIELFYDDEGYETVHMSRKAYDQIDELYYTPGQYYFLSNASTSSKMYSVSLADKVDGEWRGLQYHFQKDNPYITHEGVYDYANGRIWASFMFERDGLYYTFSDYIAAYRNGYETGSQVLAQPDDIYAMKQSRLSTPLGSWTYFGREKSMEIPDNAIKGIEKLCVTIDNKNDIDSIKYGTIQYEFNRGEGDYIVLSNGKKVHSGDIWHESYGWLVRDDRGNIRDEQGNIISLGDKKKCASVELEGAYGHISLEDDKEHNGGLVLVPGGETMTEKMTSFKKWMSAEGLSFADVIPSTILDDIAYLELNNTTYRDQLFRHLYAKNYSAEVLVETMLGHAKDLDAFPEYITSKLASYEKISMEDMPPKNVQNLELVKISSDALATVDETGITLSAFTFDIPKSIVLFEGETYGILASENNSIYETGCFTNVKYNGEDVITLSGTDVKLALPQIGGVNSAKLYFAKINDDGNIVPISNAVTVKYNPFDTFEKVTEEDATLGGYYRYIYSYDAGNMNIEAIFVDTMPPSIDMITDKVNGVYVMTLRGDYSTYDLMADLRISDNVEVDNSSLKIVNKDTGEELIGKALIEPGTYTVEVKDTSGNATSVEVRFDPYK